MELSDMSDIKEDLDSRKIFVGSAALVALLIFAGIGSVYYVENFELETQSASQNISFRVIESSAVGGETDFNVSTGDNLEYGSMPNGTNQERYLRFNTSSFTVADIEVEGNASEYIQVEDQVRFEGAYELGIKAEAREPGYYEGELKMQFQSPRTRRALTWLKLKTSYLG